METHKTLTISTTVEEQHLSMFYQRLVWQLRGFHFILVLSCILFFLSASGACVTRNHLVSDMGETLDQLEYDACESYGGTFDSGVRPDDSRVDYVLEDSDPCLELKAVCASSELFCFPSTLPGFLAELDNCNSYSVDVSGNRGHAKLLDASVLRAETNSSDKLDDGTYSFLNGRVVSCSLNAGVVDHQQVPSTQHSNADRGDHTCCGGTSFRCSNPCSSGESIFELIKSDGRDISSSGHVEISPPSLDWGQNYLYHPLFAFLTVANTGNNSILHIYEPFSTDTQFYPCDLREVRLGPGEVATICFVFLPQQLGFLSARLVLQTSSGGFVIHAKGQAIESLYGVQPMLGLDVYLDGRSSKNLSLHNPFDDTLYVKEVTARISVFSGNTSHSAVASCEMNSLKDSDQSSSHLIANQWLDIKSAQVDLPLMGIRLHSGWKINPHSTANILEVDFLSGSEGKVSGALCMHLYCAAQGRTDTVIVPLEAQVHHDHRRPISVSLESLGPCIGSEKVEVVVSLRSRASYLLSVSRISEITERTDIFRIKYLKGLLLYPGTLTRIAVVSYSRLPEESLHEDLGISSTCRLLISTNDSSNPLVEIPCLDLLNTCTRHQLAPHVDAKLQYEKSKSGSTIRDSVHRVIRSLSQSSASEIAEADELVLRNWKSQGTASGMSVLDVDELLFPAVHAGSYHSKWISVGNPSGEPVMMQLMINAGAIVDHCRSADNLEEQPLSNSFVQNESAGPDKFGFSISESAVTEAYIHPYGRALLGPVIFHPSKRCLWRGSAVIRNNLSGVEWLPLRGFGGSLSLVILEGLVPVKSLEFNQSFTVPLNVSTSELSHHSEGKDVACSLPLFKELYVKNTGDLSLDVRRIEVSGTDCGLDGFLVHDCESFSLEPGESRKLLISYKTDFSAVVVRRDLELSLSTGTFVIPMKANFPAYKLSLCRKSVFWILLKKLPLVVFVAASVTCLVFLCILPQVMAMGSQDCLFRTEVATISRSRKHHSWYPNQKNYRFSMCYYMDNLLRSVRKDETSKLGFVGRYSDCVNEVQEQRISSQNTGSVLDFQEQGVGVSGFQNETPSLTYSPEVKSVAHVETPKLVEAQQGGNLTVRTGREKGRRRRKRRAGGAGLTGLFDVSSSQSGNSTPSSPLSPIMSSTPKRTPFPSPEVDHALEARNPFAKVTDRKCKKDQVFEVATGVTALEPKSSANSSSLLAQPLPSVPKTITSKSILLPSATFPSNGRRVPGTVIPSPYLTSTSPITPNARAPGSNLCKETSIKVEKPSQRDEFAYDIWGNHFSGFHLVSKEKIVSKMIPNASEGDSQSFFAMGPQILMQKSQARSVSPAHKLPPCAVTCLLGKS